MWTPSYQQAAPITVHISLYRKSHTDVLKTVVLHAAENVKRFFTYLRTAWCWASEARNMQQFTY